MDVNIRAAGAEDAAALALVGQATFLETYLDDLAGPDILAHCDSQHARARYAAWLANPDYRIWMAEAPAGAPVGYAMLSPPDLPVRIEPGDLELKRIYTLSRFHGSGLGRRLLLTAIQAATDAGASRLLLGVYSNNDRAMAFYLRQGFTQAGLRRFRVGANAYDDIVLVRAL